MPDNAYGPAEKGVQHASHALYGLNVLDPGDSEDHARVAAHALYDPALGRKRSVNLEPILEWAWRYDPEGRAYSSLLNALGIPGFPESGPIEEPRRA